MESSRTGLWSMDCGRTGILCFLMVFGMIGIFMASSTPFNPCPDGEPPLVSFDFEGCSEYPCRFIRGKTMRFVLEIRADNNITSLTATVKAYAMGTETSFPLPVDKANVCANLLNGECPLEEGEQVKYLLLMPILTSYPLIQLLIQFSIVSEFGTTACLRLPAVVVES